jgi:cytochrome c-type biogenesis protein CcmH
MRRLAQVVLLAFAATFLMGANDAERFHKLGNKMMCMCGCNQILLQCNHVGCSYSDRMRAELTAGLERGDDDDAIIKSFVEKYGTTVLAAPTTSGFNLVAWIMPFATFLVGLVLAVLVVQRWHQRTEMQRAVAASPKLEGYRQRAREETEI